jgi:hypothetical protein
MDQDFVFKADKTRGAPLVFYTVIFFVCLATGLWGGMLAGQRINLFNYAPFPLVSPIPTPANGQSNVLIIGVDRLNFSDPRLESIWLLAYFPGEPEVKLIPVYPKPIPDPANDGPQMEEIFQLSPAGVPGEAILNYLHQEQIWWSNYILLDETGLIEILDFTGGVKIDGQKLSGALAIGSITPAKDNQLDAVKSQTQLLQELCRQINKLPPHTNLDPLVKLMPWHIKTDLNVHQTIAEWQGLLASGNSIHCEFPLENLSQYEE